MIQNWPLRPYSIQGWILDGIHQRMKLQILLDFEPPVQKQNLYQKVDYLIYLKLFFLEIVLFLSRFSSTYASKFDSIFLENRWLYKVILMTDLKATFSLLSQCFSQFFQLFIFGFGHEIPSSEIKNEKWYFFNKTVKNIWLLPKFRRSLMIIIDRVEVALFQMNSKSRKNLTNI